MEDAFLRSFEKIALGPVAGIARMGSKLVRNGFKSVVYKAKNVGTKAPAAGLGGVAMGGLFGGMEAANVVSKVKSHTNAGMPTMKTDSFFKRG